MKKLIGSLLFLTLLVSMMFPPQSQAQLTTDRDVVKTDGNGVVYKFVCAVDSLTNYTSKAFSLSEYDADSWATYPIAYGKVVSSTLGTAHVFAYVQGTYGDGNWFVVDTVEANDSVETYNTGTLDLNSKKCVAYRIVFDGITGNRSDAIYTLTLYAYRRDPDLIAR